MGSGKEESTGEGGDGADPPKTLVAKFILQADQQIMKMIEKDDSFEGLRVKKANKSWLFTTFFCGKLAFAGAFVYFAYTGFYSDQAMRFIALDKDAGLCKEIPLALSGKYFLDDSGSWSGTGAYQAGKARYMVRLNGFQHNLDEYASFMMDARNVIVGIAANASNYNIAVNLAYWAFWGYKYVDGNQVHYIRLTGDPRSILDRFYMNGGFGDVEGDCSESSSVLWDVNSGMMGLKMSYAQVENNSKCMSAMDPESLGYNAEINGDDFIIRFDARSLMLAFAINFDVTPVDLLIDVFDSKFDGKVIGCNTTMTPECKDDQYKFFMGNDPDQPGMQPVYCLAPSQRQSGKSYNFNNLCTIRIADQYVFPYMQHFGISGTGGTNNPYTPKKCDCASADGNDDYCDDFDLMIGFVFFEAAAIARDVTVNFQYLLDMMYKNDKMKLNEDIYEAAFSIQRLGGEAAKYPPERPDSVSPEAYNFSRGNLTDKDWREDVYSFCNKNCAVFSFRLYDEFNRFINPTNFDLEAGGCQDTFYTDDTPFNVAATTPPVPLVQDYVECTNTVIASVIQSLGVAMGIAAPITAGFVMLFLIIVGKIWDFLTAKKAQKLAVANASLVLDEDEDMGQLSSSKSTKKNASHSKAAIKLASHSKAIKLALAQSASLGQASNSELESLMSSKKTKKVALDAFAYRAGDPAKAFFYIKSGAFKIVDSQSGAESRKSAGELIGHTDFLGKTVRTESAQCVSVGSDGSGKANLVAFPRSALLYILGKRQGFAYDSDSDSDSESESEEDEAESKRGEEEAAHSHSVIQLDDIFCGSGRRHVY